MILNGLFNQGKRIFFFSPQYLSTAMKLYVLKIMANGHICISVIPYRLSNLECITQMKSMFRLARKLYFFTSICMQLK